ncbi:NCS2 family nucleobase:cation symporter [Schnuerera sp. xch1]|nr:NCS2 family nucleobase:cation symporter [Schnuerera sp. xch1]
MKLSKGKALVLGLQHAFTMFGATILVPILTGLDVSVSLFMAGVCTLLFHFITKMKVPVFLGSSFAFVGPILAAAAVAGTDSLAYARGGIVVAGLLYCIIAFLIYKFGVDKVVSFFPPIVTGPIIMVIGITLAPTAINMAAENWFLAIVAFIVVLIVNMYAKGFLQIIPVITGLVIGYIVAMVTGNVDYTPIIEASWLGLPNFEIAKFSWETIIIVAPIALATTVEHIGAVIAVGATIEDDFLENPGLHRTMIGDGIGTSLSALFGGPANTTYSENTGVLALTKVWDPVVMRIAAGFAIILGGVPKLAAMISTIPSAIIGGISIILFGMIAAVGARTLIENQVDFKKSKNLLIAATILILGFGGEAVPGGMALAAIVSIVLSKVLPEK